MRFPVFALFFSAVGLATAAAASADPADDINQAIKSFAGVQSVHGDITATELSGTEDMVAPNKSKESYTFMGRHLEIVKIGPDRWINMGGEWRRARSTATLPINSLIDKAVDTVMKQKDIRDGYVVTDGGMATVGDSPAHKYHLVDKNNPDSSGDLFIASNHLPLEMVLDTQRGPITFTFSKYNSLPDISPPV